MAANIFLSYSRREVGFVDDLSHELEKAGFNVWLDYRVLVPGTPWAEQIDKGLTDAEIILFVVSKSAIASPYVELEWKRGLKDKKRVVLVIFEAVDLPPELEALEWVDFRGNYKAALNELTGLLHAPAQKRERAPQSGFKVPLIVFFTALLAAMAGCASFYSFYTILIPWVLIPFAWRVLKRDFNYTQTQLALWLMPAATFLGFILLFETRILDQAKIDASFSEGGFSWPSFIALLIYISLFLIILLSIVLLLLLRSRAMQRWGKPEATMPQFANLYRPDDSKPRPVNFYIDHAPQDQRVAAELSKGLIKQGHMLTSDLSSAEAVFALISRFKTDTVADPQHQAVFPVLMQTATPSEKLSRVQWIDFRKGVRNVKAIGQLLPQPAKMLSALGVRPASGAQVIVPGVINALMIFMTIEIILNISSPFLYIFQMLYIGEGARVASMSASFVQYALLMIPIVGLAYLSIRALRERRGWPLSIPAALFAQVVLLLLVMWQTQQMALPMGLYEEVVRTDLPGFVLAIPFEFLYLGDMLMGLFALFRWKDIYLWFPAKTKKK